MGDIETYANSQADAEESLNQPRFAGTEARPSVRPGLWPGRAPLHVDLLELVKLGCQTPDPIVLLLGVGPEFQQFLHEPDDKLRFSRVGARGKALDQVLEVGLSQLERERGRT